MGEINDCFDILKEESTADDETYKEAMACIWNNLEKVAKNNNFLQLPQNTVEKIFQLDCIADSEEIACDTLLKWTDSNQTDYYEKLLLILNSIDLSKLSMKYIVNKILPFAKMIPNYQFLMCLSQQLQINRHLTSQSSITRNNSGEYKLLYFGYGPETTAVAFELYDSARNSWKTIKKTYYNDRFGCALLGNKLVIIGGTHTNKSTIRNTVQALDLNNGQISDMAPLQDRRTAMGVAVISKDNTTYIYAIGGWSTINDTSIISNTVERWDSITEKWKYVASMNERHGSIDAAKLKGKIYVAGGYGNDQKSFEVYDPQNDTWTILASMTVPRLLCSCTAYKGFIYAFGGNGTQSADIEGIVQIYDPSTNSWSNGPRLPRNFLGFVCSYANKILFSSYVSQTPSLFEFTDQEGWKQLSDVNTKCRYNTIVPLQYNTIKDENQWQ